MPKIETNRRRRSISFKNSLETRIFLKYPCLKVDILRWHCNSGNIYYSKGESWFFAAFTNTRTTYGMRSRQNSQLRSNCEQIETNKNRRKGNRIEIVICEAKEIESANCNARQKPKKPISGIWLCVCYCRKSWTRRSPVRMFSAHLLCAMISVCVYVFQLWDVRFVARYHLETYYFQVTWDVCMCWSMCCPCSVFI